MVEINKTMNSFISYHEHNDMSFLIHPV